MTARRAVLLMAKREIRLLLRSRATRGAGVLLGAVAWLPMLLLPLRAGTLGVASFDEVIPLQIALIGVVLPLLALLAGTEMLAGELEDGTLVPALTLPISRRAGFVGKAAGRAGLLSAIYVVVFAGAGLTAALSRGPTGWRDWLAVAVAGLLLAWACGGIGGAIGAAGRSRVRALGTALAAWAVLVFALDALVLGAIVALAPSPPVAVGEHGHGELVARERPRPADDPHAHETPEEALERTPSALGGWLLALNPVSLFRLLALAASPGLRPRLSLAVGGVPPAGLVAPLLAGWLAWLVVPILLGLRRFRRAELN